MRRDMPDGYRSRQPESDALLLEAMRLRTVAADLAVMAQRLGALSERQRPAELAARRAAKRHTAPDEPEAA